MSDWVVMTFGLNPLPCLVEAHRLCCIVRERTQHWPNFLVFTRRDDLESGVVQRKLLQKLAAETGSPVSLVWQRCELSDPYHPKRVLDETRSAIRSHIFGAVPPTVHFPYTGGTKAMSLHVYEALLEQYQQERIKKPIPSYLNPKNQQLMSVEPGYESPKRGERYAWQLSVQDLAELHGFQMLDTNAVPPEVVAVAGKMLALLMTGEHEPYYRWLGGTWKSAFGGSNSKDVWIDKLPRWPANRYVPWYRGQTPEWEQLSVELAAIPLFGGTAVFRKQQDGGWQIFVDPSVKRHIIPLFHFLDNQALEIYVYSALRGLLAGSEDVRHSVRLRELASGKELELDVTAVLGYELVAISCTQSNNYGECKRKGFEVLHRAIRIGGAQARAALACLLNDNHCAALERELNVEFATDPAAFRVFGESHFADAAGDRHLLTHGLRHYLEKDLDWHKPAV